MTFYLYQQTAEISRKQEFISLVRVYRRMQHVKYCYEHISATCFGLHCSHLQALRKRSN
jgi:hypothetical protein